MIKTKQEINITDEYLHEFLLKYVPQVKAKHIKKEELVEKPNQEQKRETVSDDQVDQITNQLNQIIKIIDKNKSEIKFAEVEFEKDDDSNGHIDFIYSIANFRASNYSIPNANKHKIKMIAGKIIPAIATSTALIVGSVGMEVYKYLLNVPFANQRNFYSSLALPVFVFSEPFPPKVQKDSEFDVIIQGPIKAIPANWNTWSRFDIYGPLTLQEMIDQIKKSYDFTMSTITIGNKTLFSTYIPSLKVNLNKKLEDLCKELEINTYLGKRYEILSVSGETDDMTDVYCPYIKYHYLK